MDERTKRELLDAVTKASQEFAAARLKAEHLGIVRRDAIRRAMDAGVPRQELADAVGVRREVLYQILSRG